MFGLGLQYADVRVHGGWNVVALHVGGWVGAHEGLYCKRSEYTKLVHSIFTY